MTKASYRPTSHLVLDRVTLDLTVARRIPQDLALRHHALPIAEAGGAITVVMANPDDPVACREISEALGATPCFVRGDIEDIDALLIDASWNTSSTAYRFLVCETLDGSEAFINYACGIGDLFHAQIESMDWVENKDLCLGNLRKKADEGYSLLILGPQVQSFRKHPFACPMHERLLKELSISLLVVPKVRWPISRILVLIQGEKSDDPAVEWGVRLAQASTAEIVLLAIVPSVPGMYQGLGRVNSGLPELLSTKTKLGQHLRWAAERLVNEGLDGTVQLRQGPQDWQIRSELLDRDCDLIVVGAEHQDWLHRTFFGANPCPLLHWVDRPVLVAK